MKKDTSQPRWVLLDTSALMYRAFHAVKFAPEYEGKPMGMVYGFVSSLLQIIEFAEPDYLISVQDSKGKTFRHEMLPEYKGNRSKAPDEFYDQIPFVNTFLDQVDIPILKEAGLEADDLIGSLSAQAPGEVWMISHDMDLTQLVTDRVKLVKAFGRIDASMVWGRQEVYDKLQVWPEQVVDYKALVGDSSDNYKGVPGIGPKSAVTLIDKYENLNNIFDQLGEIKPAWAEKIEMGKSEAELSQKLAQIKLDQDLSFWLDLVEPFELRDEAWRKLFDQWGFRALGRRLERLTGKKSAKELVVDENQGTLF